MGQPPAEREMVQQIVHEDYNFEHEPTIGLVLCASRNETVARYALGGIDRPVGVARYKTASTLQVSVPDELQDRLPRLEEISAGVQRIVERHAPNLGEAESDPRGEVE